MATKYSRLTREVLIKTKDIVHAHDFELLYADTDSVFLKKIGVPIEDCDKVKNIFTRGTGIPISIEQDYKSVMLLSLKASESISTKTLF